MVRVDDVERHHERAKQGGARILRPPAEYPYGERQYSVEDFAGHQWTFSQSIADVAPENGAVRPAGFLESVCSELPCDDPFEVRSCDASADCFC
jgi:hypothetical protein